MITSIDNPIIIKSKKLLDKKYRYSEQRYLIEGEKLVDEAIRFHQKLDYLLVTESKAERYSDAPCQVIVVSDRAIKAVSDTVTNQGVIAVAFINEAIPAKPHGNCLILDNLQDAGNVGTILRTAAATGYNEIYLYNCVDVYSPKVVRSAMSAHFIVKTYKSSDMNELIDLVRASCPIVVADMSGNNVFDTVVPVPHALAIGNEGNGISQLLMDNSDVKVSLPMKNNLESLNASVSAGVLMYQLSNK